MSELLERTEAARKLLNEAVEWNFGSVGSCPIANMRLDECKALEAQLEAESPDEWKEYSEKWY